jgi:hypothetical protein
MTVDLENHQLSLIQCALSTMKASLESELKPPITLNRAPRAACRWTIAQIEEVERLLEALCP